MGGENIDGLNKMKAKAEKDKAGMERDLQEARAGLDEVMRERANHERNGKLTQGLIVEAHQKLDEMARALNEADSSRKKLQVENQDLTRQIEETEAAIAALGKNKISLTTQLEDTKRLGDSEARDRAALLAKFKNMNTELENLKERIEEESQKKSDALKALSKAQAEIQLWRSKFETEALGRIDELDSSRQKLSARLQEAEETIETLNQKVASTEKTKHRLETELEDLQLEYERVHAAAIITEKRGRNFDKVIGEWKAKVDDLTAEIEASQKECRNYNSELFRLKAAWDETTEQLDVVKRENKNLADEIKDLLDQLGDGGRSIHELDKQRRRLEVEKEELQAALEEAEAALEQEENKVLRATLELGQTRQEIDRKISEKVEEFENSRKNHQRAMDSLQASLDGENKAKTEALRIKKKLQQFFNQHMFVLEQEEYVREGLEWGNVDFGMDLQKCITMFEKPMGLLAILEEESLFPKATDATFAAKLHENLLGKCENFQKANPKPDPNAHFAVVHYAAIVSYNLTGWLTKNKDPLNDTVIELLKHGSNKLMVEHLFKDHPGQPVEEVKKQGRVKKGAGKTVSAFYKSQLDDLMRVLYATEPSFIRCVVPNTHKQPGGVEPGLVMHQYQCNGVLAGIAICRAGFPNKVMYPDFKERYNILAAAAVAKAKKDKDAAGAVLDAIQLDPEKFRLGHTKVFFRAD